jgi:hypothetical protein
MGIIRVASFVFPSDGKRRIGSGIKGVDNPWEQNRPSYHIANGLHGDGNAWESFWGSGKGRVSRRGASRKQGRTITNKQFFWGLQKD